MVQQNQQTFFLETIYYNDLNIIKPYEIIVPANVHPEYFRHQTSQLNSMEQEDLKVSYSVCQFFRQGQGCDLNPHFKTAVCRTFICSTIEDKLSGLEQSDLIAWVKQIKHEATTFQAKHQAVLQAKEWELTNALPQILDYFEQLS